MVVSIVGDEGQLIEEREWFCLICGEKECVCGEEKYKLLPFRIRYMNNVCTAHLVDMVEKEAAHAYLNQVIVRAMNRSSQKCDYCEANSLYVVTQVPQPVTDYSKV